MFESQTVFSTCVVMLVCITLLNLLTRRSNRDVQGTMLSVFYPVTLLASFVLFMLFVEFKSSIALFVACSSLFVSSLLLTFSIARLLNQNTRILNIYTLASFVLLTTFVWLSINSTNYKAMLLIYDLQRVLESTILLTLVIKTGRTLYPNTSIIYSTLFIIQALFFTFQAFMVSQYAHLDLSESFWLSVTLLVTGIINPIFIAIGAAIICNEKRAISMRHLMEKAQQEVHIRGLFLSTMSHEIRTPLNGILGSAQLMLNQPNSNNHSRYCEAIISSAESLSQIVDKILEYASLEQSTAILNEEDIEFLPWLKSVGLLMSPLAEQKGLRFDFKYQANEDACFYFDHQKIRQVLVNLLGNAVKFTEVGQISLCVEALSETENDQRIKFTVTDTGNGIAKKEIPSLSLPYVQASEGKHKGGTGLGLAICSRILKRFDSELNIKSELKKGSQFSFVLNLNKGVPQLVESKSDPQAHLTGLQILLVEDLPLNQRIAIEFMAIDEHKVKLAENGLNAIEMAKQYQFDVILLDMNLPDISGVEVVSRLNSCQHPNSQTPILAFTAGLSPSEIKQYLDLGIKDIVGKPIKQDKLRQAIYQSQQKQISSGQTKIEPILFFPSTLDDLKKTFDNEELINLYNDFILSARFKIARAHELQQEGNQKCISILHRQASTAFQLGFNLYGLELKKMEKALLSDLQSPLDLDLTASLWQQSLESYLHHTNQTTN